MTGAFLDAFQKVADMATGTRGMHTHTQDDTDTDKQLDYILGCGLDTPRGKSVGNPRDQLQLCVCVCVFLSVRVDV